MLLSVGSVGYVCSARNFGKTWEYVPHCVQSLSTLWEFLRVMMSFESLINSILKSWEIFRVFGTCLFSFNFDVWIRDESIGDIIPGVDNSSWYVSIQFVLKFDNFFLWKMGQMFCLTVTFTSGTLPLKEISQLQRKFCSLIFRFEYQVDYFKRHF